MKIILSTASISEAESLCVALDAHGIPAFVSNENSSGILPSAITVAVNNDADYAKALAVLRDIERTPVQPWFANRRISRLTIGITLALVAIAVLVCLQL